MTPEALASLFPTGQSYAEFTAALADRAWVEAVEAIGVRRERPVTVRPSIRHVIAIVEDWCRDSMDSLPVLAGLLAGTDIDLRIFHRDQYPALMATYRKDGQFDTIPVYVLLDGDFRELGRYVERPPAVMYLRRAEREQLASRDPELGPADWKPKQFAEPARSRLRAGIEELRWASRSIATGMIEDALRSLLERSAPPAPSGALSGFPPIAFADAGDGEECEVPA